MAEVGGVAGSVRGDSTGVACSDDRDFMGDPSTDSDARPVLEVCVPDGPPGGASEDADAPVCPVIGVAMRCRCAMGKSGSGCFGFLCGSLKKVVVVLVVVTVWVVVVVVVLLP